MAHAQVDVGASFAELFSEFDLASGQFAGVKKLRVTILLRLKKALHDTLAEGLSR
jgi:hypothetical protein